MSNHFPSDAATLLREGIEAAQSGNRFIARMRLEKAAELEPANADCWIWLAWTSESPKGAMFALRHAMKCAPTNSATKKGLSWVQSLCEFSIASSEMDELLAVDGEDTKPFVYKIADSPERRSKSYQGTGCSNDHALVDDAKSERTPSGFAVCHDDDDVTTEDDTDALQFRVEPCEDGSLVSELVDEITSPQPTILVDSLSTEEMNAADGDTSFVTDIVNRVNAIRDEFAHLRLDTDGTSPSGEAEVEEVAEPSPFAVLEPRPTDESAGGTDFQPVVQDGTSVADVGTSDACPPPVPSATTNDNQPTILAVDDSTTVRKLISITLEKHGYRVVTAEDGMAALQCLSTDPPGLVLTDINMPRLDGYQLCKLIKKHEKTRLIPVIMLSGKDGVFDKLRGRLVGCNDYVTKPFESAEIIKKVSTYLPIPQPNR